jgi:phosphate-selective porin OprO and OprP
MDQRRALPSIAFTFALSLPSIAAAQPSAPEDDVGEADEAGADAAGAAAPEPEAAPPEPPPAPPAPPAGKAPKALEVTFDKGIVFATADDAFKARLSLRSQLRFESSRPLEDGSEVNNRMYIPRSRIQLEGNAFGEDTRYKLELGLSDRGSYGFVRDLYVEKALGKAWLRAGQWKRPFNRHDIVSDFSSQFNERSNTADYVGGGRDLGIAIHNDYEKSAAGLEWVVGMFNGFSGGSDRPQPTTRCTQGATAITCTSGTPTNVPTEWGPALLARVAWNSKDSKGYSEGDLEGGGLRYSVGLGYKVDLADFDQGSESSTSDNMSHGLTADAMIKISGFSLELGAYMMKLKSADAGYGALAQAGYFVVPKKAEVAARFSIVPTTGDRDQLEIRAAFNWFWEGHRYKWISDIGMVQQTGEDPVSMEKDDPDLLLRSMLQLTF